MTNSRHTKSPKVSMILSVPNRIQLFFVALIICVFTFSAVTVFGQEVEDSEEFTQGEETKTVQNSQNDPVELFNKGQDAHAKGDLQTALKFYEEALKIAPEFPEAEYQKGTIYQTLGKSKEAEKAFRRAIEMRRDWTLPIAELGAMLVRKGEYIEAESLLNRAIRINGMSFPAYVALTELKIKTKASKEDLKSLLAKLQYLTTKSKIPASIWVSRAAIERSLGDKESAKNSLRRALLIDDKNSFAMEEAIEIALLEGDSKGAVKNSRILIRTYPNSLNAKILLARSLHSDGQSDGAFKVLDTIENPSEEVKKLKTAIALSGNDNIESLEEMLKKDKNNVSILGRLCVLSRAKQPNKALEYCKKASQLEPTEVNHAVGYGAALVQLKRYLAAIELFNKLLDNFPENYTIRANLATALFQLRRYEEAKKQYLWITQKQPNLAVAYYFLAISHDQLKEYMDAMANYQQFLKLANNSLQLEIDKVNLRLPSLQKQIKNGQGKKK